MLHGCTQDPDDFAAGTEMNAQAELSPCLVLYPAQSQTANSSRCWNWFNAIDQQREQGEPSIIADMTRAVIAKYNIDPQRVYVAGLSAGGAMAAIMGNSYPDLYAAVGIHSGLPAGAATDLGSALQAMRAGMKERRSATGSGTMPIIVFHGDSDKTVHPRNGEQLIAQHVGADSVARIENGNVPGGHHYTRTLHHNRHGDPVAEQWLIHGAGHAWSGGSSKGTYTDDRGPQATREMMRFFATRKS
jgi:poly(hydroxyalkanoate) depolymerase family esterase